jgi:ferric-dicitrate binding protein FerR (iron transport regulator)
VGDYLWDKSGTPDPEVERLERVLTPARYDAKGARKGVPSRPRARARGWRSRWRWASLALAAVVVLGVGAWLASRRGPSLAVARIDGQPRIDGRSVTATGRLGVGEWLATDAASRARIELTGMGEVAVEPGSRVRLLETTAQSQRLELEQGAIAARVVAPPRIFVVETPAARAVDLGCAYSMSVDDAGAGLLRVTSGWVSLDEGDRSVLVPAGAACHTRIGVGPGTPYFEDAPQELQAALQAFDFAGGGPASLRVVLTAARPRDTLSLFHLLPRATDADRRAVYARLAALAPPPPSVTEPDVEHLDPPKLKLWEHDLQTTW